jgi:hypothetical protein
MPLIYFMAPRAHKAALHERVIAWIVWLMMIFAMLRQYYEVREDGLFLHLRLRKQLIPYVSMAALQDVRNRNSLRSIRTEANLVRVVTKTGETYTFGVEEKDRFLSELLQQCPEVVSVEPADSAGSIV